jgi:hypothetical protein
MDNFDLNISNYSVKELEEILTLVPNYNEQDISYNKDKICNKIMNDSTLSFEAKVKLGDFFNGVSNLLGKVFMDYMKSKNSKDDTNGNVSEFKDMKNTMLKNTNNLIISDPYSAHNIKVEPTRVGPNFDQYGTMRGVINPLLRNTILKGINIDSRFRDNYYTTKSTDLQINLPFRLDNVISYRVVGITLPLSFYNISQSYGNNIILFNVYDPTSGLITANSPYKMILPDGCYNTTQGNSTNSSCLEVVINNYLANSPDSPNADPLTPGLHLRYTIDRTSGRSIFAQDPSVTTPGPPPIPTTPYYFEIITNVEYDLKSSAPVISYDTNLMLRLGWVLGYRAAKYSSSNTNPPSSTNYGSIVSEGICFTKFPVYGFLSIDDYNKNANDYFVSVYSRSISVPNIISKVNFTQFFELVGAFQAAQGDSTSNAINREKRFFGPVMIQKLRITLYDDLGRILDLNNMDWALELAFECVYNM